MVPRRFWDNGCETVPSPGQQSFPFGRAGTRSRLLIAPVSYMLTVVSAAALVAASAWSQAPAERVMRKELSPAKPASKTASSEVTGRVLGPGNKPVAGARVIFWPTRPPQDPGKPTETATGADGRFRLHVPTKERPVGGIVMVRAKGLGADWVEVGEPGREGDLRLRPSSGEVPISGRILDLEGRPVKGARVRVVRVGRPTRGGSLAAWAEGTVKWLAQGRHYVDEGGLVVLSAEEAGLRAAATTGKDGRFRLDGINAPRAILLDIQGPGIERRTIWATTLTSPFKDQKRGTVGVYGASFDYLAGPAQPVSGTVKDARTGRPVAGVRIIGRSSRTGYARGFDVEAVTDAHGRYRLEGLPKDKEYRITADTSAGLTYLPEEKRVADAEGFGPLSVDFALSQGSLVRGRVRDRDSGKPAGGWVVYYPLPGNKQYQQTARGKLASLVRSWHKIGADGSFRLLAYPGPAAVCVLADGDDYLRAPVTAQDALAGVGESFGMFEEEIGAIVFIGGNAYRVIRPGRAPAEMDVELHVVRGQCVRGHVFDPDGKAAAGAQLTELHLARGGARGAPVRFEMDKAGGFTASGLDPREPRTVLAFQSERKLAGYASIRGGAKEELRVQLRPWGRLTGRVLDTDGRPVSGASMRLLVRGESDHNYLPGTGPLAQPIRADGQGRFDLPGIVPGLKFELIVSAPPRKGDRVLRTIHEVKDLTLKEGETRNLGELRASVAEEN